MSTDVVIVGSGPNGLAAAACLVGAGVSVTILEGRDRIGGGARTEELTLPGFRHDVCSAVHPTGLLSPFLKGLPLEEHGLQWVRPPASAAHPLDDGRAVMLEQSFEATGATLGPDADIWRRTLAPFVRNAEPLLHDLLGPLRLFPKAPLTLARFGWLGLRSATHLARRFRGEQARALFAGCAAHSILPLNFRGTAAVGLVFALCGHVDTWPVARGGSVAIVDALASYIRAHDGRIELERPIRCWSDLPPARAWLFDTSPRGLLSIVGDRLPNRYRRRVERYQYGPGAFKLDWALDGPIPWKASACLRASTVHVGGTLEEIAASEQAAWQGNHCERPFVLVCQQSDFDRGRAPDGKRTGYAYCHVPHGSTEDMTEHIEAQVERFAPGFRDRILARHTMSPTDFQARNPNYIGGAVTGGAATLAQLFTRPVARWNPYTTPDPSVFLCSASTPPGGGVHGMCGFFAAQAAMKRLGLGQRS